MSPMRHLVLLAVLLGAPSLALGGDMPPTWAPQDATVRPWSDVSVEGWSLYRVTQGPKTYGVAEKAGATLRGAQAFTTVRADAPQDAQTAAALACLFADPGGAAGKPWLRKEGVRATSQQAIAKPPVIDGPNVVYWRFHERTSDMVRVTVDLASGAAATESGPALLEAADGADPVAKARKEIVADDLPTIRKGIQRLVQHGEPPSLLIVMDLAAHHQAPVVRAAATEALATVHPEGGVEVIGALLAEDPARDVRLAAARTLEAWADPASRPWLERGQKDADAAVAAIARRTLSALP